MFAQPWPDPFGPPRRLRKLWKDGWNLDRLGRLAELDLFPYLARLILWIVYDIRNRIDGSARNIRLHKGIEQFGIRTLRGPFFKGSVDQLFVLNPTLIVRETGIIGQVLAACNLHETLVNRIAVSPDDDELVVLRAVCRGGNYP